MDNLRLAEQKARRGKLHQPGVKAFDKNPESNLLLLQTLLASNSYRTSAYDIFPIHDPKERLVYRLPYFPDRIAHHAVMNILKPVFVASFTADTYSCIEKRGIHGASFNVRHALKDVQGTQYCLKLDIRKFYPSVDHEILKNLLRRKFKDPDLLNLLDEIIDSAEGLPIGNYLSQYLANFYLSYFDHWIKEELRIKHYFRYSDDMVILSPDKSYLHTIRAKITRYLLEELKLRVKDNHQVFPVNSRGINFVGFVHFHGFTLMRSSIKKSFARAVARGATKSIASYYGWAKYSNSKNLLKKFDMLKFSELGVQLPTKGMVGNKIPLHMVLNVEIPIFDYEITPSKYPDKGNGKCLALQIEFNKEKRVIFTGSGKLMETLEKIPKSKLPFTTTIVRDNQRFVFT